MSSCPRALPAFQLQPPPHAAGRPPRAESRISLEDAAGGRWRGPARAGQPQLLMFVL